jgi:alanyl-tRNA synthetase
MGDRAKDSHPDSVCVFTAAGDGKTSILVSCGKEAVAKGAHAGKIVKELTALCGGSGGGRPDNAMGGCTEPAKLGGALAKLPEIVANYVK